MRRRMSELLYRFVDFLPKGLKYRLVNSPLKGLYRFVSSTLGPPIIDGYHIIEAGPLQGSKIFTGSENIRGYPSVREYIQGIYEPIVSESIKKQCKLGSTAMDIGAHYGYFSMIMSQAVGQDGLCIAFEANPSNYEKIIRTREANHLVNLVVEHNAITDKIGVVQFKMHVNTLMGYLGTDDETTDGVDEETVPGITIDEYVDLKQISNLSFLKIDIEGAERKAISGGMKTLRHQKPTLLIEVHDFYPPDEMAKPLVTDLYSLGYQVFRLENNQKVDPATFIAGHILAKADY